MLVLKYEMEQTCRCLCFVSDLNYSTQTKRAAKSTELPVDV